MSIYVINEYSIWAPCSGSKCKRCISGFNFGGEVLSKLTLISQGLTTELTANTSRIAEINSLADQLITTDHRHSAAVKKRRKEIIDM